MMTRPINEEEARNIAGLFSNSQFFYVTKSDMNPKIIASDIVAIQTISQEGIIPGEVYLIKHRVHGHILRKIMDSEGETLLLSSGNEEYGDFRVNKIDVLNLAKVTGVIRTSVS